MKHKALITRDELRQRIAILGKEISVDYKGKHPVLVGVLRGSFVFLADLIREIDIPVEVDFISVESYGNATTSSGVVRMLQDLNTSVKGRHVILVEDIVDTGLTLRYLIDNLKTREPKSLVVCTLLDKHAKRKVKVPLKYAGFVIPDKFVVGYGLDHAQLHRNIPHISWIEEQ